MKIEIKVIAGAKKNFINKDSIPLKVYLTAPPVEGKANKALVEFLAEEYQVSKSRVFIIKGLKSNHKIVNIVKTETEL